MGQTHKCCSQVLQISLGSFTVTICMNYIWRFHFIKVQHANCKWMDIYSHDRTWNTISYCFYWMMSLSYISCTGCDSCFYDLHLALDSNVNCLDRSNAFTWCFMTIMAHISYNGALLMFSVLGKIGLRILRHMSQASTRGPWTMKFIFLQLHLSTVSFLKDLNMCALFCTWGSSVWSGTEPILFSALDVIPNLLAKIRLSGLWYHPLYPSPFPAVCFSSHPHPPSCPVYFLSSPLIFLADIRTGKRQCNVAMLTAAVHLTGLTHVLASQSPLS